MKLAPLLAVFLLVGLATTAPTEDNDLVVVTEEILDDLLVAYTGHHDIVSITVPLNAVNFEDVSDDDIKNDFNSSIYLFFVEADINDKGEKDYKGLYILKDGKATKLLEHGTDSSAANDETKIAYFGAKDGIYVYNPVENKAEKYGSVTDSVIGIVKENGTDSIYILTEDRVVYKVTDEGTKKVKIDDVNDAQQIVLDYSNNLYYYGSDKHPYVVNVNGVKKIEGLPDNPTYVNLVKPLLVIKDGVGFISDDKVYAIYVNGTSEFLDFELRAKPTAYAPEATLIQYYAYNKKIYSYNMLKKILGGLEAFLDGMADSIATRSKSDLKA